ncbi:MAG: hypothetical protein EBZ88_06340, partial [Actinobacteria bacterium]|nr:hypothetical protein [Actinomycetota bacterium]
MLTVKIKKKSTVLVCSKVGAKKVWQIRVGVTPGVTPGGTTATTLPAGGAPPREGGALVDSLCAR